MTNKEKSTTPPPELLALSERATPGQLTFDDADGDGSVYFLCVTHPEVGTVSVAETRDGCDEAREMGGNPKANAEYLSSLSNWFRNQDWTTTPNPELPESVVTDEMVERAARAIFEQTFVYAGMDKSVPDKHWQNNRHHYLRDARYALEAVIQDVRVRCEPGERDYGSLVRMLKKEAEDSDRAGVAGLGDLLRKSAEALTYAAESVRAANARAEGLVSVPDRIEEAPLYWRTCKSDAETGYCNGWNDCRKAAIDAAQAVRSEVSEGKG